MFGIRFQLALVNELRGLLKQRAASIETAAKCRRLLEKHESEQAQAASKGKADQVQKLDRQIQDDRTALEQAEEISEQITQGLFRSELDRFDKIKAEQLRDMMGQLSASHFQYAKRLGIMWQGFINELGFDPQQMMDKAQTVFKANPGDMKAGGGVH